MDALIESLKAEPALAWKLAVNVQGHAPNSAAAKKAATISERLSSWSTTCCHGAGRMGVPASSPTPSGMVRTGSFPCWRTWAIPPGTSPCAR